MKKFHQLVKDIERENTPSNKTQALTKSVNMCIWEIRVSNQLFTKGSYTEIKFLKTQKHRIVSGKTMFFVLIFYSPFYLS